MADAKPVTIAGVGPRLYGGFFTAAVLSGNVAAGDAAAGGGIIASSAPAPPPPPPPSPGTPFTDLTLLTPGGAGVYPWSHAHAFPEGDLKGEYLDGIQVDTKSKWPDGSIQVGLLSGIATSTGSSVVIPLGTGKPPLGTALTIADLKATGIAASLITSAYGNAAFAAASSDWDTPFLPWTQGPLSSSWIYRKQVGTDAHLVLWMEVTLYKVGAAFHVRVIPWLENGFLNVANPTSKPGDYSFVLGGTTVFPATTLPVWHHTRQPLISGSTLEYWVGGDKTTVPKHDAAYLEGTGLVAPMLSALDRNLPAFPSFGGISGSFTPYQPIFSDNSMHSTNMGSAGGADSIGIQPGWESIALVDNSRLGYEQMLRESYRFGAHQIHYRDETTNKPISFAGRAGMQLRFGDALLNVSSCEDFGLTNTPVIAGGKGDDTNKWSRSHQPGSPVLAYITSGRYWFMEECQFIAGINFLSTPWTRSGTQHHVCRPVRSPTRMQMREAAWCLRNLGNAALVTPDSDTLKDEYITSVDHNVDYYHDRYAPGPDMPDGLNPMGLIEHEGNGTTGGDQAWQYDFFVTAWAKLLMTRVASSQDKRTKVRAFFDWVSRSVVGRSGGTGATEHLARWISTSFAVGGVEYSALFPGSNPAVYPNWSRTPGNGPWWPSWGAYYDWSATQQGYTGGRTDGDIAGGYSGDSTAWTMHAIVALRMCASLGAPGAVAAMARLESKSGWSWWVTRTSGIWGGDTRPTNAIATRTMPLEVMTAGYVPPVGQRSNVNLNSMTDVDWDAQTSFNAAESWWNGYSQSNSQGGMLGYSGSVWAQQYGARGSIIVKGGGHGYNIAQHCYPFDLETFKWRQVGAPRNLPSSLAWAGWADYRSTSPTAHDPGLDQRVFSPLWYDYNHSGSFIKFDEHSYLQTAYLGPNQGGGKYGSLLLPQTTFHQGPETSDPRTGISTYWSPHTFSMLDGRMARAATAPYGPWVGSGYSNTIPVLDPVRNRLWYLTNATSSAYWLDTATPAPWTRNAHTIQKSSGGTFGWVAVKNSTYIYVPGADCIVGFAPQNSNEAPPALVNANLYTYIFSVASGVPVALHSDTSYLPPPLVMPRGGIMVGVAWVSSADVPAVGGVGKFYIYEGYGDDFCYTLTPSSLNFATCTWTTGRERFTNAHTGADPISRTPSFDAANAQIFAVMGRFAYVPALKSFVFHDGPNTGPRQCVDGALRTGIVQLWRPPGTPI